MIKQIKSTLTSSSLIIIKKSNSTIINQITITIINQITITITSIIINQILISSQITNIKIIEKRHVITVIKNTTNKCFICGTKENSEHLILHCKATQTVREELKQEFNIKEFSLKNLFNTKNEQEFLFKFLERTQISTRN